MATTAIEWTEETWNPVTGCDKVSPGCKHCYAETMSKRLQAMGQPNYANGFKVTLQPHMLEIPLRRKKPTMYFVNSMSDLFHKDIPFNYIDKVFAVMALCPQHTFQVLTKRADRMQEYCTRFGADNPRGYKSMWIDQATKHIENKTGLSLGNAMEEALKLIQKAPWPLPNVWLGVSCENQKYADERIPLLLQTPAAVRFVSAEPLLGPIDFRTDGIYPGKFFGPHGSAKGSCNDNSCRTKVDLVIVGGESGPGARPMHPDWARSIRDQCVAAGVSFFFKQWGCWRPPLEGEEYNTLMGRAQKRPAFIVNHDGTVHCTEEGSGHDPKAEAMIGVGKKKAGRLLDGREWNEMPSNTECLAAEKAAQS